MLIYSLSLVAFASLACSLACSSKSYGYGEKGCGIGCRTAGSRGDGAIDAGEGEECDHGAANGDGVCTTSCRFESAG